MDDLADVVEDLEGAVVGFLGASFCLLEVENRLVFFLGGSLGIFFFSSAILSILYVLGTRWNAQCVAVAGEGAKGVMNFQGSGSAGRSSDIMQTQKKKKKSNNKIRTFIFQY